MLMLLELIMAKNQNQLSNILHLSVIKILYDTQKTLGSGEQKTLLHSIHIAVTPLKG